VEGINDPGRKARPQPGWWDKDLTDRRGDTWETLT